MTTAPIYTALRESQPPTIQALLADAEKAMRAEADVIRSRARMDALWTVEDLFDATLGGAA